MSDSPSGGDLPDLERALHGIRFEPRASLGPEISRRARQVTKESGRRPRVPRAGLAALAAGAAVAAAAVALTPPQVTVDRCCYDLDGGGEPDDGVLIEAVRDDRVRRLRVYEDRDRSRTYTAGDVLRLDRGRIPAVQPPGGGGGLITIERCCLDFDGGGPSDDGLLVIGVPPDRVVMAAIYERTADSGTRAAPLR